MLIGERRPEVELELWKIYFLSGFGTAILVNIRLNSALRSLSGACNCVYQYWSAIRKAFRRAA